MGVTLVHVIKPKISMMAPGLLRLLDENSEKILTHLATKLILILLKFMNHLTLLATHCPGSCTTASKKWTGSSRLCTCLAATDMKEESNILFDGTVLGQLYD